MTMSLLIRLQLFHFQTASYSLRSEKLCTLVSSYMLQQNSIAHKWLLLITPLLTLVLCILIVLERQPYYASWSDPTYCYLFNGLNLASGYFKVGQIDHPGTPLQLYAGALLRFFHLFSADKDIVHDVLTRPEWYLFRIGISSSIFIAAAMFVAAQWMLRFTGNIIHALIIQLTHVVSFYALVFSQNLMTEFILVITGILSAPLIVGYTLNEKRNPRKILAAAAILTGIMLAGKISSFPVFVMWLLLIRSAKNIFVFIAICLLSFVLVTFPAWHAAEQFFKWLTNIATHTGKYGSGNEGFADWSSYFINVVSSFAGSWLFTGTYIIILITVVLNIKKLILKNHYPDSHSIRTLGAAWIAITLQIVVVAKHFSGHYLIPAQLLLIPCWVILLNLFLKIAVNPKVNSKLIIVLLFAVFLLSKSALDYQFFPGLKHPGKTIGEKISHLKYDLALLDCNVTAPLPQAALLFGVNYSGNTYKEILQKIYPPFYTVNHATGKLRNWHNEFSPNEALHDGLKILYYRANATEFNIHNLKWPEAGLQVDSVWFAYKHQQSGEAVYLITIRNSKVTGS